MTFPDEYATALGRGAGMDFTLGPGELDSVLALARQVAHGTERRFAPVSSYLAGRYVAARTGGGASVEEALGEAVDVARRLLAGRLGP